jgi:hypothetical protein
LLSTRELHIAEYFVIIESSSIIVLGVTENQG